MPFGFLPESAFGFVGILKKFTDFEHRPSSKYLRARHPLCGQGRFRRRLQGGVI